MRDNSFFCFAGIYEKWLRPPKSGEFIFDTDLDTPPPSQVVETFSIITTAANPMVSAVHDRDAVNCAGKSLSLVAGRPEIRAEFPEIPFPAISRRGNDLLPGVKIGE